VTWSIQPEPSDETERRALLAAAERALADEQGSPAYAAGWWRAGFDDLGRGPAAEQSWREPGVVEP
jgi:hypothetical protein